MFPAWPRTSLSMDKVTCEGSKSSKDGWEHDNSHSVVKVWSERDRSAGTNGILVSSTVVGCGIHLAGCA